MTENEYSKSIITFWRSVSNS